MMKTFVFLKEYPGGNDKMEQQRERVIFMYTDVNLTNTDNVNKLQNCASHCVPG